MVLIRKALTSIILIRFGYTVNYRVKLVFSVMIAHLYRQATKLTGRLNGMKIILITLFLLVMSLVHATCQKSVTSLMLQHSVAYPTGNTKDFINTMSFRGFMVDYRHHSSPQFCMGISSGLQTFFEVKEDHTMSNARESSTFSGNQYRYMNSVPFFLVADYYMQAEELVSRFVGLGVGTTYNRQDRNMGLQKERVNTYQMSIAPEIGMRFGYDFSVSTYIVFRYTHSFQTKHIDSQSYCSFAFGLMFR